MSVREVDDAEVMTIKSAGCLCLSYFVFSLC